jgi:hypothetical protein
MTARPSRGTSSLPFIVQDVRAHTLSSVSCTSRGIPLILMMHSWVSISSPIPFPAHPSLSLHLLFVCYTFPSFPPLTRARSCSCSAFLSFSRPGRHARLDPARILGLVTDKARHAAIMCRAREYHGRSSRLSKPYLWSPSPLFFVRVPPSGLFAQLRNCIISELLLALPLFFYQLRFLLPSSRLLSHLFFHLLTRFLNQSTIDLAPHHPIMRLCVFDIRAGATGETAQRTSSTCCRRLRPASLFNTYG